VTIERLIREGWFLKSIQLSSMEVEYVKLGWIVPVKHYDTTVFISVKDGWVKLETHSDAGIKVEEVELYE